MPCHSYEDLAALAYMAGCAKDFLERQGKVDVDNLVKSLTPSKKAIFKLKGLCQAVGAEQRCDLSVEARSTRAGYWRPQATPGHCKRILSGCG